MTTQALRVLVAQLGARMHYAVPRAFWREQALERVVTDVTAATGNLERVLNALPRAWIPDKLERLRQRRIEDVPPAQVESCVMLALRYGWSLSRARSEEERTRAHLRAGDQLGRAIASVGLGCANAVYGFNSASSTAFEYARTLGARCVLEQTIAPRSVERVILDQEHRAWPGWENRTDDSEVDAFCAREEREWRLADAIVCGSEFVRSSIGAANGPISKCRVVPYGVDPIPGIERTPATGRLRVLFAGMVCLRKGAPYLWEAARELRSAPVQFRVIGSVQLRPEAAARLAEVADVAGPVPRLQVAGELARADVLVLPSLVEGSATICYEAIAAGLPVITTPNSGSVIRDGVDGFVVPARDGDALASRIALLAGDPDLVREMARCARERAQEHTVAAYGTRLVATVRGALHV